MTKSRTNAPDSKGPVLRAAEPSASPADDSSKAQDSLTPDEIVGGSASDATAAKAPQGKRTDTQPAIKPRLPSVKPNQVWPIVRAHFQASIGDEASILLWIAEIRELPSGEVALAFKDDRLRAEVEHTIWHAICAVWALHDPLRRRIHLIYDKDMPPMDESLIITINQRVKARGRRRDNNIYHIVSDIYFNEQNASRSRNIFKDQDKLFDGSITELPNSNVLDNFTGYGKLMFVTEFEQDISLLFMQFGERLDGILEKNKKDVRAAAFVVRDMEVFHDTQIESVFALAFGGKLKRKPKSSIEHLRNKEKWPDRVSRFETPESFIVRVYGDPKALGLSLSDLRHLDNKLYQAFQTWKIKNKPTIDLPTRREVTDRLAQSLGVSVDSVPKTGHVAEAARVRDALARRQRRAEGKPKSP